MRFEVDGMEEVYAFIYKLPSKIDNATTNTNEKFMKDLRRNASFKAPRSMGKLRKSFKIKRSKEKGKRKQWKLVSTQPYAYWVIEGSGPGPGRMPPVQAIMDWKKLKPSKVGQTDRFAAALKLAEWIGKHGTKPNDFIQRALDKTILSWEQNMNNALDGVFK